MGVVPEEADARSNHGAAEDGEFSDEGHALEFEVVGEDDVAADVSEDRESASGDDGAADGEAVEAVSEVNSVGGAHQNEYDEGDEGKIDEEAEMRDCCRPEVPLEVGVKDFDEGDADLRGEELELR